MNRWLERCLTTFQKWWQRLFDSPEYMPQPLRGKSDPSIKDEDGTSRKSSWRNKRDQPGDEPSDDLGRYVVFGADGTQIASFDDLGEATACWQELSEEDGEAGFIIDTKSASEVTPVKTETEPGDDDIEHYGHRLGNGRLVTRHHRLAAKPNVIRGLLPQLARLEIPVLEYGNAAGAHPVPTVTTTVAIQRRKVSQRAVPRPQPVPRRREVPYVTDDQEFLPVRDARDLPRVSLAQLAIPPALLAQRLADRELVRRAYFDDDDAAPVTDELSGTDEPEYETVVDEWTEEIAVTFTDRGHMLAIVFDTSLSMFMRDPFRQEEEMHVRNGLHIGLALATLVVGRHVHDASRYVFRAFQGRVDRPMDALTPPDKQLLIEQFASAAHSSRLGDGTNIPLALKRAAEDVRRFGAIGQAMEILLITDGDDHDIDRVAVRRSIGPDISLHTVVVNSASRPGLRSISTTYCELAYDPYNKVVRTA